MSNDLNRILDDFESKWRLGNAPSLAEAVQGYTAADGDAAAERRECIVELIKIDMEFRWRSDTNSRPAKADDCSGRPNHGFLEGYLEQFPEIVDDPQIMVDLAGEEYRVRLRWGDGPSVDEYVSRFGDHGNRIRDHFPRIRAELEADSLLASIPTAAPNLTNTQAGKLSQGMIAIGGQQGPIPQEAFPKEFGSYQLLEELGQGAMGTVYRAVQRQAAREVAVKVIRPDHLGGMSDRDRFVLVGRFQNEAHAAARLEHENIVRVYEVGEVDGQPFFSMQWIAGSSLAAVLRQGPLNSKKAAEYMEPLAAALECAHLAGVLHRDLKPLNILIDKEADKPYLADFGIAKLLDSGNELTRFGTVMGTPPYMSPEQADGRPTTVASDVYGIGATLYHTITGRPPFQSATVSGTLKQVLLELPVPPRRLNPDVHRDVETICLKCLEKEPARRYGSAGELADDLRRFRLGQPIAARPLNAFGRSWRWCRRNRAVAALSAAVVAATLLALLGTSTGYFKAVKAQKHSEDGFRQARRAFDEFVEQIRDERALNEPQLRNLKEDLLRRALTYYENFLVNRASDPSIAAEVAQTHYRVGILQNEIVSTEAALDSFRRARLMQRRFVDADPSDVAGLQALGTTLNATGKTLAARESLTQARDEFAEAADIRQRVVTLVNEPDRLVDFQRQLANTLMNLGIISSRMGEYDQAMTYYQNAQDIRRTTLELRAHEALRRDFAKGLYNIGHLQQLRGEFESATARLQEASEEFDQLRKLVPDDPEYQLAMVECFRLLGDLAAELDQANNWYEQALMPAQALAKRHPTVDEFQQQLAEIEINLGQVLLDGGKPDSAIKHYESAVRQLNRLLAQDDKPPGHRRNLALVYGLLADAQASLGRWAAANESIQQCHAQLEILVRLHDDPADRDAMNQAEQRASEIADHQ